MRSEEQDKQHNLNVSHIILDASELFKLSTVNQVESAVRCASHAKIYQAFCKRCCQLLCLSCIMQGAHQTHNFRSIKSSINENKSALDSLLHGLASKKTSAEKLITNLEEQGTASQMYIEEALRSISKLSDDLRSTVSREIDSVRQTVEHFGRTVNMRKEESQREIVSAKGRL